MGPVTRGVVGTEDLDADVVGPTVRCAAKRSPSCSPSPQATTESSRWSLPPPARSRSLKPWLIQLRRHSSGSPSSARHAHGPPPALGPGRSPRRALLGSEGCSWAESRARRPRVLRRAEIRVQTERPGALPEPACGAGWRPVPPLHRDRGVGRVELVELVEPIDYHRVRAAIVLPPIAPPAARGSRRDRAETARGTRPPGAQPPRPPLSAASSRC